MEEGGEQTNKKPAADESAAGFGTYTLIEEG